MSDRTQFGLVLEEAALFAALPDALPPEFTVLRLGPAALADVALPKKLRSWKPEGLEIDELADRTTAALAPESNLRLKLDFLAEFRRRCRQAVALGADRVTAGFDLDRAVAEPVYRERLKMLLLNCAAILDALPLRLLFKLRLPLPPTAEGLGAYDIFLREFSSAKFGLSAELHPHEPAYAALPGDLVRPVRFLLKDLDFVYEPLTGNRLTAKALLPQLRYFMGLGQGERRVFFYPAGIAPDAVGVEVKELAALINEINK